MKYILSGLIAVVLILIVVILVMDHQAKRRLHKNLFNNKVLRKNLKHLEETGELPVVAPKKERETIHSDYEGRTDCIEIF